MSPQYHTLGTCTLTESSIPLVVAPVARLGTQVQALYHEVMEIGGEARNATMRIRSLHEEQRHHSGAMLNQQAKKEDLTNRVQSLVEEVVTLRQQIIEVKARASLVEQRENEATRKMSDMDGHLVRNFGI